MTPSTRTLEHQKQKRTSFSGTSSRRSNWRQRCQPKWQNRALTAFDSCSLWGQSFLPRVAARAASEETFDVDGGCNIFSPQIELSNWLDVRSACTCGS